MKRLHEMGKMGMFMGVPEHGRPYRTDAVTYMAVPEHGKPHRKEEIMTLMIVSEHGKPYNGPSYDENPWDNPANPIESLLSCTTIGKWSPPNEPMKHILATRMAIGEHGQPYRSPRLMTKMAIGEHGKPFKSGATTFITTNMAIKEHGNPYKKTFKTPREEHDYMKQTCFDYCPNIAGMKCGRPGCH